MADAPTLIQGETWYLQVQVNSAATGRLTNAVLNCELFNPSAASVTTIVMTRIRTGTYDLRHATSGGDPVGKWTATITATDSQGGVRKLRLNPAFRLTM